LLFYQASRFQAIQTNSHSTKIYRVTRFRREFLLQARHPFCRPTSSVKVLPGNGNWTKTYIRLYFRRMRIN